MDRRSLFQVVGGTALAHSIVTVAGCQAGAQGSSAKDAQAKSAAGEHAHKMGAVAPSPLTDKSQALAKSASDCILTGEACLEHCLRVLASGDTSMADCARSVQQLLAVCRASMSLAAMGSEFTAEIAALCAKACGACAENCQPHIAHHQECKACYESCIEAQKACAAFA